MSELFLWEAKKGRIVAKFEERQPVNSVAYFPSGKKIATGGKRGDLSIWDIGKKEKISTVKCHEKMIYNLTISPDGTKIATVGTDQTVKVWKLKK